MSSTSACFSPSRHRHPLAHTTVVKGGWALRSSWCCSFWLPEMYLLAATWKAFFFFFFFNCLFFLLARLGVRCYRQAVPSCGERRLLLGAALRLSWWLFLLQGAGSRASVAAAHAFGCLQHVDSSQTRDQTQVSAGESLSTGPPRKSWMTFLKHAFSSSFLRHVE